MTDLSILKENFNKFIEKYEQQDITLESLQEDLTALKFKVLLNLDVIEKGILEGVYDETELLKNIKELIGLGCQIGITDLLKHLATMEEKDGQRSIEKEV